MLCDYLAAFALDANEVGTLADSLGFRKGTAEWRRSCERRQERLDAYLCGLLASLLRGDLDGQALAALAATIVQNEATTESGHTGTEPVGALTT